MWFLYSHYDQSYEFFNNREEAIAEYRKWRDNFKSDLKEAKEETGKYDGLDGNMICEMIILSKVIHGIEYDEDSRGGFKILK